MYGSTDIDRANERKIIVLLSKREPAVKPTRQLGDQLYREEVLAARAMKPEDKLLSGPRLFDFACRIAMDGIRHQFPGADDGRVREILAQRVALGCRLERPT
jgi:hypothetical protein